METLDSLRREINTHREKNGLRKPFPKELWEKIYALSTDFGPGHLSKVLGISGPNLSRRLKCRSRKAIQQKGDGLEFLEVSPAASKSPPQKIILELPHNIIMRIET